jgi:hypothetical protein
MSQTKEQIAARKKEYQKKNKEKLAAYAKEYREKNKEQIAIKAKEYQKKNKEKLAAYKKEYNKKNKEKIAAYHRKYNKKNKEKIAARNKAYQQTEAYKKNRRMYITQYRKKNKEKIAAQVSEHYYKNKKHKMSIYRQRVYNITPEEYDTMLEEQNHKCKICSIKFNDNYNLETKTDYLHAQQLDHCHTTNKVRGILCPSCNIGLGHFKDSPENITNAINYLKETL